MPALQKLLRSRSANALISVRRVTQQNVGNHTPGVDQVVLTTPQARGRLVDLLSTAQPWRAHPARRVSLPKATGKLRPLGIPTMLDRCLQARVKNAREPFWEARFAETSYGFRPGRGCHDAIAKSSRFANSRGRKRGVVDADIKGGFATGSHRPILEASGAFPARERIKEWVKAGYGDQGVLHETPSGTGQGAVVSPLLANRAVPGLEEARGIRRRKAGGSPSPRARVRSAEDFCVWCEPKEAAQAVIETLTDWLATRGLTLSTEKTRIVHRHEGFDFLGFTITPDPSARSKAGYQGRLTPSQASLKALRTTRDQGGKPHRGSPVRAVLRALNPVIGGWANSFRSALASQVLRALDRWMFLKAVRWVNRTHPHQPTAWRRDRSWGRLPPHRVDPWVFGNTAGGASLWKFQWFKIERQVIVGGTASPDDPALQASWAARSRAQTRGLTPSKQLIAARHQHGCPGCGQSLFTGEELQTHHIVPRAQGGTDAYPNRVLVHSFCHQHLQAPAGTGVLVGAC